jgi:iron complex outermembrane receptor protein
MRIIRKNLKVLMLVLSLLLVQFAYAQKAVLTGKVTDRSTGEALPGVTVVVKGTTNGTLSDMDGNFRIEPERGQTIQFSFVGYVSQEIVFQGQTNVSIQLAVSTEELSEVVVIGYGQVKKEDATGSVVAVSSKDFNKGAITSPQDLLVGKSAGVVITTAGGAPGSGATIRVRGGSSLNASTRSVDIIDAFRSTT